MTLNNNHLVGEATPLSDDFAPGNTQHNVMIPVALKGVPTNNTQTPMVQVQQPQASAMVVLSMQASPFILHVQPTQYLSVQPVGSQQNNYITKEDMMDAINQLRK